jgi:DNA-directed RNA polymerase specialized sigma24 family protein
LNALEKAISELPEELKNAFILTALEDRPQAETADFSASQWASVGQQ